MEFISICTLHTYTWASRGRLAFEVCPLKGEVFASGWVRLQVLQVWKRWPKPTHPLRSGGGVGVGLGVGGVRVKWQTVRINRLSTEVSINRAEAPKKEPLMIYTTWRVFVRVIFQVFPGRAPLVFFAAFRIFAGDVHF